MHRIKKMYKLGSRKVDHEYLLKHAYFAVVGVSSTPTPFKT